MAMGHFHLIVISNSHSTHIAMKRQKKRYILIQSKNPLDKKSERITAYYGIEAMEIDPHRLLLVAFLRPAGSEGDWSYGEAKVDTALCLETPFATISAS